MLYLKLLDDKTLKLNQSNDIFEGENLADKIKINISEKWQDYDCTLNIFIEDQIGDIASVKNEDIYEIQRKLLLEAQILIIWIEMRKEEQIVKSEELKIQVQQHHSIDEVVDDVEITIFEEMIKQAIDLNKESLEIKENLSNLNFSFASEDDVKNLFEKGENKE